MYVKDLNLKNIKVGIDKNIEIPKKILITEEILEQFNKRKFTPTNINIIIELILFLEVDNYNDLILKNTVGSKESYQILDSLKDKVDFPDFMTQKFPKNNLIPYEVLCETALYATTFGLVNWLKFAYKFDYGWNYHLYCVKGKNKLYNVAIKNRHVDILQLICVLYIKDNKKKISFEFDSLRIAIKNCDLEMVKFLITNKCKIDNYQVFDLIIESDGVDIFKYFFEKTNCMFQHRNLVNILRLGKIEFLKYLDKVNYSMPWDLILIITQFGNLDMFKYVVERNWFVEKDSAAYILYSKDLNFEKEYLDYMRIKIIIKTIIWNRINILKYLIEDLKFSNYHIAEIKIKLDSVSCFSDNKCLKYLEECKKKINQ